MIKPDKHSAQRGYTRLGRYEFLYIFAVIAAVFGGTSVAADDPNDREFLRSFTMWLEVRNDGYRQIEIDPLCIFALTADDGTVVRERLHLHVRLMRDDSSDTDPYAIRSHATKSYHVTAPDLSDYAALLGHSGIIIYFVVQRSDKQRFSDPGVVPFRRRVLRKTVLVKFW